MSNLAQAMKNKQKWFCRGTQPRLHHVVTHPCPAPLPEATLACFYTAPMFRASTPLTRRLVMGVWLLMNSLSLQ
jgi:hypothetical protein